MTLLDEEQGTSPNELLLPPLVIILNWTVPDALNEAIAL